MPTVSRQVVIKNKRGLHARPAMEIVQTASSFASKVRIEKGGADPLNVDGKSIMEIIMLEGIQGTVLTIHVDGDDAVAALEKICAMFDAGFGEVD